MKNAFGHPGAGPALYYTGPLKEEKQMSNKSDGPKPNNQQPTTNASLDDLGKQLAELGEQIATLARLSASQGKRIDDLKQQLADAHADQMIALQAAIENRSFKWVDPNDIHPPADFKNSILFKEDNDVNS